MQFLPFSDRAQMPQQHSIRWRIALYFVLFSSVIVFSLSIISYLFSSSLIEQKAIGQLSTISAKTEDQIQNKLQQSRADASLLASLIGSQFSVRTMWPVQAGADLDDIYNDQQERSAYVQALHVFNAQGEHVDGRGLAVALPSPPPRGTIIIPMITRKGWTSFDVIAPIHADDGQTEGWLVITHDTRHILADFAQSTASIGSTAGLLLSLREGDSLLVITLNDDTQRHYTENVGDVNVLLQKSAPVALSARGEEGVGYFIDYNGNKVLASFRSLPALGWGLTVKVNLQEVMAEATRLSRLLGLVGFLFLGASFVVAFSFARQLTQPLLQIATKMEKLGPGHWSYRRTVRSGDELQQLDTVVAGLTKRLRELYDHLEDEVELRTDQLRQEFAKDRAILESLMHGLLVLDGKGVIQEANRAALEILHLEASDVIGVPAASLLDLRLHQHPVKEKDNPILQCLKTRREVRTSPEVHHSIARKDKTYVATRIGVTPLFEGRKFQGAIVFFQDVTTERQLDYMKSEFISLASHQLRTPLSTMQWYLEMLSEEQDTLTEAQQSFIVELRMAAHRINNIVSELMDATRLQQGGVEPMPKKTNVSELVHNITSDMKALANEHGVTCSSTVPKSAVTMQTDPMLLHIVLQNLLSNAIKYNQKGGKAHVSLSQQGSSVKIAVKDNGVGIPIPDQDRIFQKLFRAHNARKMQVNGSGLGLYSSKVILDKLGGEITFTSTEGKGSVFTVTLQKKQPKQEKKSGTKKSKKTR